jgi:signal peptidase I
MGTTLLREGHAVRLRRRGVALILAVAMVLGLLVFRLAVAAPVRVISASMLPTLSAGDVVLVSRSAPAVEELHRGDLVTFRSPEDGRRTLKRVLGLPGDELVILDSVLHVNEHAVPEPYVDHAAIDGYYSRTFTVPDGTVFVLGDNRGNSVDSRDYGPVPAGDLTGRVLFRVWPPFGQGDGQGRPPKP